MLSQAYEDMEVPNVTQDESIKELEVIEQNRKFEFAT